MSREDLSCWALVAIRFALICETLRWVDSRASRVAHFAAQVGHMSPNLTLGQSNQIGSIAVMAVSRGHLSTRLPHSSRCPETAVTEEAGPTGDEKEQIAGSFVLCPSETESLARTNNRKATCFDCCCILDSERLSRPSSRRKARRTSLKQIDNFPAVLCCAGCPTMSSSYDSFSCCAQALGLSEVIGQRS